MATIASRENWEINTRNSIASFNNEVRTQETKRVLYKTIAIVAVIVFGGYFSLYNSKNFSLDKVVWTFVIFGLAFELKQEKDERESLIHRCARLTRDFNCDIHRLQQESEKSNFFISRVFQENFDKARPFCTENFPIYPIPEVRYALLGGDVVNGLTTPLSLVRYSFDSKEGVIARYKPWFDLLVELVNLDKRVPPDLLSLVGLMASYFPKNRAVTFYEEHIFYCDLIRAQITSKNHPGIVIKSPDELRAFFKEAFGIVC